MSYLISIGLPISKVVKCVGNHRRIQVSEKKHSCQISENLAEWCMHIFSFLFDGKVLSTKAFSISVDFSFILSVESKAI